MQMSNNTILITGGGSASVRRSQKPSTILEIRSSSLAVGRARWTRPPPPIPASSPTFST